MNITQINVLYIAALTNFGLGIFLIADSLFLHLVNFNYSALGSYFTNQVDPYLSHSFYGLFFVTMGIFLFWIGKANDRRME